MHALEPHHDTETSNTRPPQHRGLTGTTLAGRYQMLELLASGAMGRVYRAKQLPLGRDVAIKIFGAHTDYDVSGSLGSRFLLEAASAAKVVHPHSVTIYDYGERDGVYFMAMELLRGESLASLLHRERRLCWSRVAVIGLQVARALSAAHAQGVIHRDIKPGNLFLEKTDEQDDVAKVIDYGLVKSTDPQGSDLTRRGTLLGTPGYMSPEQIRGAPFDTRTDLYALGATLYEMLVGHPPLSRGAPLETMMAHVYEALEPVEALIDESNCPKELAELIGHLLAKEPEARPKNMRAVVRVLARLLAKPSGDSPLGGSRWLYDEKTGWSLMGATGLLPRAAALRRDGAHHATTLIGLAPSSLHPAGARFSDVTKMFRRAREPLALFASVFRFARRVGSSVAKIATLFALTALGAGTDQNIQPEVRFFVARGPTNSRIYLGRELLCTSVPCMAVRRIPSWRHHVTLRWTQAEGEDFLMTRPIENGAVWFRQPSKKLRSRVSAPRQFPK